MKMLKFRRLVKKFSQYLKIKRMLRNVLLPISMFVSFNESNCIVQLNMNREGSTLSHAFLLQSSFVFVFVFARRFP